MSELISETVEEKAWDYFEKHAKHDEAGNFYRILKPYNTRQEYVAHDTGALFQLLLKNWEEDTNDGICEKGIRR